MAITKIRGAQIADDTIEGANLAPSVAGSGLTQDGSGNLDIGSGTGITVNTSSIEVDTSVIATRAYVDNALSGLDFQPDVLDIQTDGNLDPGAPPTEGDRYLITDAGSLHANFGTITGIEDNDIVEYDGSDFVVAYDVSVQGEGALVWDRDSNTWQRYDGADWEEFGGLSGVTAGAGLTKTGNTIDIGAGSGITVSDDDIAVKLNSNGGLISNAGGGSDELSLDLATNAGLTLTSNKLAVNLLASGGLSLASNELSVSVDDIIDTSAGLENSGGDIAVKIDNTGVTHLEFNGTEGIRLAESAAGNGLTGGGTAALSVKANLTAASNIANVMDVGADGVALKIDDTMFDQDGSNQLIIANGGVDTTQLAADSVNDTIIDLGQGANQVNASTFGFSSSTTYVGSATTIEEALEDLQNTGFFASDYQQDVLDLVDGSSAPPTTVAGDRYILDTNADSASSNGWTGLAGTESNGDIVQYTGAAWFVAYDVSVQGEGAMVWDRDTSAFLQWDGTNWELFEAAVTATAAGAGLAFNAGVLSVNAGSGININVDDVEVKLNSNAGLVSNLGSGSDELAINAGVGLEIDTNLLRLAAQGNGIAGGAGSTLSVQAGDSGAANLADVISVEAEGISVKVDESTIDENGSGQLEVVDGAIGLSKLTGLSAGQIYVGSGSAVVAGSYIIRENLSATVDGVETDFTLANTPFTGTEQVFLNGILQNSTGSADYSISGDTITFTEAPLLGDVVLVNYIA